MVKNFLEALSSSIPSLEILLKHLHLDIQASAELPRVSREFNVGLLMWLVFFTGPLWQFGCIAQLVDFFEILACVCFLCTVYSFQFPFFSLFVINNLISSETQSKKVLIFCWSRVEQWRYHTMYDAGSLCFGGYIRSVGFSGCLCQCGDSLCFFLPENSHKFLHRIGYLSRCARVWRHIIQHGFAILFV